MASIIRQIAIQAAPDDAWDALRDWPAVHQRLVPGFLRSAVADGEDRIVTFFDGIVVRERIVGVDDSSRRIAWTVTGSSQGLAHYNASAQVVPVSATQVRFIWIADVLPHAAAAGIGQRIERGLKTIKETLAGSPRPGTCRVESGGEDRG